MNEDVNAEEVKGNVKKASDDISVAAALQTVKTPDGKNVRNVFVNSPSKKEGRPRVLFFHGEYTNENVAQYILKLTRWDKYFDFVIPGAIHDGCIAPKEIFHSLGLEALQRADKYSHGDKFYKWGACYEFINNDPHEVPQDLKDKFQHNAIDYIKTLDKEFGPFDGVMGFCEGGATLNYALGLKEDKALDGALESVKFFIHVAPWETPLAGKYFSFPKSIPTLSLFGENEEVSGFPEAFSRYHKSFKGYYDTYVHNGKHNYPIVSSELENTISALLEAASHDDSIIIQDQYPNQGSFIRNSFTTTTTTTTSTSEELTDATEFLVSTVIGIIVDTMSIDTIEVTKESSLVADLDMDSLHVMEILTSLEEAFEVNINTELQDQMIQEIDTVQDVINFAQQLKHGSTTICSPPIANGDALKTDKELVTTVLGIVADTMSIDTSEVTKESSLAGDLDMDSLHVMEILTSLEEAFEVNINTELQDQMVQEIDTVQDVINFAQQLKHGSTTICSPSIANGDALNINDTLDSGVSVAVSEKVNFSSENYKLQSQLDELYSMNYKLQSQLDDVSKKFAVLEESVLQRDEKIQELESILERNRD